MICFIPDWDIAVLSWKSVKVSCLITALVYTNFKQQVVYRLQLSLPYEQWQTQLIGWMWAAYGSYDGFFLLGFVRGKSRMWKNEGKAWRWGNPINVMVVEVTHVPVTIFHFLYGLYIPLPRDPTTCAAAFTFSFSLLYFSDSFRLILLVPLRLDSYGLIVTPTFYRIWLHHLL